MANYLPKQNVWHVGYDTFHKIFYWRFASKDNAHCNYFFLDDNTTVYAITDVCVEALVDQNEEFLFLVGRIIIDVPRVTNKTYFETIKEVPKG